MSLQPADDRTDRLGGTSDWTRVQALCRRMPTLDPTHPDRAGSLATAARGLIEQNETNTAKAVPASPPLPEALAGGHYRVTGLLGEGGRKFVYQAHGMLLNREVAFAMLKLGAWTRPGASDG